jgi:predicted nicotinamide N-methyase
MAMDSKYAISLPFCGHTVSLLQMPRDRAADGQDNTGWCVWEASNVALRFVASDANVAYLCGDGIKSSLEASSSASTAVAASDRTDADIASSTRESLSGVALSKLRVMDLSCGAGLVALACATVGATVTATDVPVQIPQLEHNIAHSKLGDRIHTYTYFWGEPVESLRPTAVSPTGADIWYDVIIASDIVFIALRDSREKELQATLRLLAPKCRALLFVFEERLMREEQEFMEQLGLGASEASLLANPDMLRVEERKGEDVRVEQATALQGAGGHADTDLWNPGLFWEPPPIRMFVIRAVDRT